MSITRTPRPDTRRLVAGGRYRSEGHIPPGLERALELRARARRANLIVSTRETPLRPAPKQRVYAGGGLIEVSDVRPDGDTGTAAMAPFHPGVEVRLPMRALRVVTSW